MQKKKDIIKHSSHLNPFIELTSGSIKKSYITPFISLSCISRFLTWDTNISGCRSQTRCEVITKKLNHQKM